MKSLFFSWMILCCLLFLYCNYIEDEIIQALYVSDEVENAFSERFPHAKNVTWEVIDNYRVAGFTEDMNQVYAWFDNDGIWYMTETELPFSQLPETVKNAFRQGQFHILEIEHTKMLERKDKALVYVLNIELENKSTDIIYNTEGIFIKSIPATGPSYYIPEEVPEEIRTFINHKYPEAQIAMVLYTTKRIKINILYEHTCRVVAFDTNHQWIYTGLNINIEDLPRAVTYTTKNESYKGYEIVYADLREAPQGNYYLLQLYNSEIPKVITVIFHPPID